MPSVSETNKFKLFNDPIYGFISLPSERIFDLVEHPYFQRLRRISQLGLSSLVYPGANHTRFHHALGAMHLMLKAIQVLRRKGIEITASEEESAQIAILLHDIGHGPFSHALEQTLLDDVHHETVSRMIMERLNGYFDGALDEAIAIFEGRHPKGFLHELISSQLDMDRMYYLNQKIKVRHLRPALPLRQGQGAEFMSAGPLPRCDHPLFQNKPPVRPSVHPWGW